MAEEIIASAALEFRKDSVSGKLAKVGLTVDMSGGDFVHRTQTVGTSEEALGLGDLTTLGYCLMINRDDTNFISVRQATSASDLMKLEAGEVALFRFDADCTAPFVIADTANCVLEYIIIED